MQEQLVALNQSGDEDSPARDEDLVTPASSPVSIIDLKISGCLRLCLLSVAARVREQAQDTPSEHELGTGGGYQSQPVLH